MLGDPIMLDRDLKAGRELDALVAEKAMGQEVTRGVRCFYDCGSVPEDMGLTETERPNIGYGGKSYDPVPHYSTDIASAWLVHQNVLDRLFSVRQSYYKALQDEATAGASLEGADSYRVAWPDVLGVLRHKMPEAICRAALTAVSVATHSKQHVPVEGK